MCVYIVIGGAVVFPIYSVTFFSSGQLNKQVTVTEARKGFSTDCGSYLEKKSYLEGVGNIAFFSPPKFFLSLQSAPAAVRERKEPLTAVPAATPPPINK